MSTEWDGRYPPPFSIYKDMLLLNLISLRDTPGYTQEFREHSVRQMGWNSWEEIMDAGLRDAKIPEHTHCPECGRPYND